MSKCWYMPATVADQRAENRQSPNRDCDFETLADAGVFFRHYDPATVSDDTDGFIKPLLAQLGYHAHDVITISPDTLGEEKFESLAKQHFEEHLHEDDEVRLIIEGTGYFDVRSAASDEWIRVQTGPGDCLVLPAGIYHRFTTNESRYIKTLRLFKENPKWIALPRSADAGDASAVRTQYLARLRAPRETIAGPASAPGEKGADVFALTRPGTFDDDMFHVVATLAAALQAGVASDNKAAAEGVVVLYVTGSASPYTKGESWCPDCVAAKPHVLEGLELLRKRYTGAVAFVEAPVERAAYLGNPAYPYRSHPALNIRGVPTVFVFTLALEKAGAVLAEAEARKKEKTDAPPQWSSFLDVRARLEEPTAALMSGW